ncbi:hypothetical protein CU098_001425, partial [Rhizopus stolonifer]
LKERIIATNKLFKYLATARDEITVKNQEIEFKTQEINKLRETLNNSLRVVKLRDQKQAELTQESERLKLTIKELEHRLQVQENSPEHQKKLDELNKKLATVQDEKAAQESKIISKESYIKQLEAQCHELRENQKKQIEVIHKPKQPAELKKKREEINQLQQQLTTCQTQMESIQQQLQETQEEKDRLEKEKEQLEEEVMSIKIDQDFSHHSNQEEVDQLGKQVKDFESHFHQLRGECTFYRNENAFLKQQLMQLHTQLSQAAGLDTILSSHEPHVPKQAVEIERTETVSVPTSPKEDKTTLRSSSGLVPPPSKVFPLPVTLKKKKKTTSKLTKFVNATNPGRVLENKPIGTKRPSISTTYELNNKKLKTTSENCLEQANSLIKQARLPTEQEIKDMGVSLMKEIDDCYGRIKTSAVIGNHIELVSFGIPDQCTLQLPKGMDHREKIYAWYMAAIYRVSSEEYNALLKELSVKISSCLKTKSSAYAFNVIPCLINVSHIWKEAGLFTTHLMLFDTFQAAVAHVAKRTGTPDNIKMMYDKLKELFEWNDSTGIPACIDKTFNYLKGPELKLLYQQDKDLFKQTRFNIVKTFELAFSVLDNWNDLFDNFIRTRLWSLLGGEITGDISLELIGVLGRLGVSQDPLKPDKPGVATLLNCLIQVMDMNGEETKEDLTIKCTAARSIMKIAGKDPKYHEHVRKFMASLA